MKQRKHLPGTSIRARIWQLAGLTCATVVVLGLLLVLELERGKDADHAVDHTQAVLKALGSFTTLLMDVETGQRGYLLTRQEEFLTPYSRAVAGYRDQLARLKEVMADEAERPQIQRLAAIFDDKLEVVGRTIESAHEGKWEDALAVVNEGRGRRDTEEFRQLGQEIADREVGQLATRQATAERENSNTLAVVLGGGALIIFLTVAAATRTVSQVDGPLRDLLVGIAALADGRLDRRLDIRSSDEIGRVVEAFNDTADHLLAANQARERVEADLAQANRHLLIEVEERGAAQTRLSESLIELARSNEDLDNFAYIASHDLKAPLRGIRNLTDWISEDVKGKVEGDTIANLALLHTRVERLDMLVDSLLQYSRVGRLIYAVEEIDTADLIADIADYIAPPKGFTVAYRGEAPLILSKRAPLEQVLRNLIGNGLKHHDQTEGTVTVSVRDLGDLIEFQIEDDGPGIDPKFHERIFKIFQTLKSRDTLEASGMGLAIVKKAVERHGGTITVESAPPRRGTIFVFTWAKDTHMLAA
jgi:signal transduction histidine kinase